MIEVTPTHRDSPAELIASRVLQTVLAFACGVLATLVLGGGPEAERTEQLIDELHQARRATAYAQTLAARFAQDCGSDASDTTPQLLTRVTPTAAAVAP